MITIDKISLPKPNQEFHDAMNIMEEDDSFIIPDDVTLSRMNGIIQFFYRKNGFAKRFSIIRWENKRRCKRIK
jgi:adenylate cyclase